MTRIAEYVQLEIIGFNGNQCLRDDLSQKWENLDGRLLYRTVPPRERNRAL